MDFAIAKVFAKWQTRQVNHRGYCVRTTYCAVILEIWHAFVLIIRLNLLDIYFRKFSWPIQNPRVEEALEQYAVRQLHKRVELTGADSQQAPGQPDRMSEADILS